MPPIFPPFGLDGCATTVLLAGFQCVYPTGGAQGAGCQAEGWQCWGQVSCDGEVRTILKGEITFAAAISQVQGGAAGVRAQSAPSYVLEITEFSNWEVPGQPPPQVPANVKVTQQGGTAVSVENPDGETADASVEPPLEVPFETITKYEVAAADAGSDDGADDDDDDTDLPDTGVGPGGGDGGAAGFLAGLGVAAAGAAVALRGIRRTPKAEPDTGSE